MHSWKVEHISERYSCSGNWISPSEFPSVICTEVGAAIFGRRYPLQKPFRQCKQFGVFRGQNL